jgi:hypothetical protein
LGLHGERLGALAAGGRFELGLRDRFALEPRDRFTAVGAFCGLVVDPFTARRALRPIVERQRRDEQSDRPQEKTEPKPCPARVFRFREFFADRSKNDGDYDGYRGQHQSFCDEGRHGTVADETRNKREN